MTIFVSTKYYEIMQEQQEKRPRKYLKNRTKWFNIRVSDELMSALEKLQKHSGSTKTEVIEKLILDASAKID